MLTGKYLFDAANEFLIFEKIKSKSFKIQEDLSPQAKDLVLGLLKYHPNQRIGYKSLVEIKKHEFFKNIDWKNLETSESPIKYQPKKIKYDDRESELEGLLQFHQDNKPKEIVLTGLVKKMKYVFMYNTRQLILYNNQTLEYFDPKKNELKGTILLNKKTKAYVKSTHVFILAKPEREFAFNCIDVPA